ANDGQADSSVATVTITINAINDAPVAIDDSYSMTADTTLTVSTPGVLGNDSDIEGNPLGAVLVAGPSHGILALNSDGSFGYTPAFYFNGIDSFTYKANDGAADSQPATVTITVIAVPTTATGPTDLTVTTGETASFSTEASGTGPFTYEWTQDGVEITGATNASYTIDSATTNDAGTYCVVITGAANSVTNCATLTVNMPTTASGPGNLAPCLGASAAFSTEASGTGPFTYQWTKDGVDIGGATGAIYGIGSVSTADAGTYCVVVGGAANRVTNCATLTVNALTVATAPADTTVCQGADATFSTTAGGTPPFACQWTLDGSAVGTDGPTMTHNTTGLSVGAHTVSVVVSGQCGSVTTSATLTVNALTVASGPADTTVCQGADATFSASANGTAPFSYQWTLDGAPAGTNE